MSDFRKTRSGGLGTEQIFDKHHAHFRNQTPDQQLPRHPRRQTPVAVQSGRAQHPRAHRQVHGRPHEESVRLGGKRSFFTGALSAPVVSGAAASAKGAKISQPGATPQETDTQNKSKGQRPAPSPGHNPWASSSSTSSSKYVKPQSLRSYIDGREEHHKTRKFQDEFRMFLKKCGLEYDEA